LLREFNQRCEPPWSESELIHKIKSAANAVHLLPRGHLLGDENGSPVSAKPMPSAAAQTEIPKRCFEAGRKQFLGHQGCGSFSCRTVSGKYDGQDSASVLPESFQRGSGEKVLIQILAGIFP